MRLDEAILGLFFLGLGRPFCWCHANAAWQPAWRKPGRIESAPCLLSRILVVYLSLFYVIAWLFWNRTNFSNGTKKRNEFLGQTPVVNARCGCIDVSVFWPVGIKVNWTEIFALVRLILHTPAWLCHVHPYICKRFFFFFLFSFCFLLLLSILWFLLLLFIVLDYCCFISVLSLGLLLLALIVWEISIGKIGRIIFYYYIYYHV